MNSCPNPNSAEWKAVVSAIGEFEAMRDFIENGEIRNIDEIRVDKPNLFDLNKPRVKPGAEENKLFSFYESLNENDKSLIGSLSDLENSYLELPIDMSVDVYIDNIKEQIKCKKGGF